MVRQNTRYTFGLFTDFSISQFGSANDMWYQLDVSLWTYPNSLYALYACMCVSFAEQLRTNYNLNQYLCISMLYTSGVCFSYSSLWACSQYYQGGLRHRSFGTDRNAMTHSNLIWVCRGYDNVSG
jgi:hypothetical protein